MSKQCAFTICARNYLGLAKVLKKSFTKFYDINFYIFIADEIEDSLTNEFIFRSKTTLNISAKRWQQNSFKYDITEFCTYLKPYCFDYLQKQYGEICYFDPDIMFFSSAKLIYDEFGKYDFLLTPHLLEIQEKQRGYFVVEDELRHSGIFNFGFIGLKTSENTKSFVNWWKDRLDNKCYRDVVSYQFTDQCWGNYIFSYFDISKIKVFRNKGLNLAPWNFEERKLVVVNGKYYVVSRNVEENGCKDELVFAHYSGFNYVKLLDGTLDQQNEGHESFYDDLLPLFNDYKDFLFENSTIMKKYIGDGYSYNYFSNGKPISLLNRRLYRALLLQGEDIGSPFDSKNERFYEILKKKRLIDKYISSSRRTSDLINDGIRKKFKALCSILRFCRKILGNENYFNLLGVMKYLGLRENQLYLFDKSKEWLWWQKVVFSYHA